MAIEAVDGVLGNVLVVDENVIVDPFEVILAVVADDAPFLGDLSVAADQVAVAVGAIHAPLEGQLVGERHAAAEIELLFGDLVAVGARAQPLVEMLPLEMAEETGGRRDRHVFALHDLAVATGATEFFAAADLLHVGLMVERDGDIADMEVDAARQEPRLVTAGAKATRVGDFGGRAGPGPGSDVLRQLDEAQQLAPHLTSHSRREVALDAGNVLVRRCFPGLVIRFHNVATGRRLRARRVPTGSPRHDHHQQRQPSQKGHAAEQDPTPACAPRPATAGAAEKAAGNRGAPLAAGIPAKKEQDRDS